MAKTAKGHFATYRLSDKAGYPDDEEAVSAACDLMFNMCGNAGQEAMIGDYLIDFDDWALNILESETDHRGSSWEDFAQMVIEEWYEGRLDKWQGTSEIWSEGWIAIAEQSGYHDAKDEYGEGAGQEFYA